jgi:hypothetical protein
MGAWKTAAYIDCAEDRAVYERETAKVSDSRYS